MTRLRGDGFLGYVQEFYYVPGVGLPTREDLYE